MVEGKVEDVRTFEKSAEVMLAEEKEMREYGLIAISFLNLTLQN